MMSADGSIEEKLKNTAATDNGLITLDIDELCKVIDSEVKSEPPSPVTTPMLKKKEETMKGDKMDVSASSESSEATSGGRKRSSQAEPRPGILKKPKIAAEVKDKTSEVDDKKMIREMELDIWDEDPKGLYGLSPEFLKAKGIKPPLTNWVHLSNIPCDKTVLKEVMELAGNVLVCHVVRSKTGYAKVKYSHPIEAAQAVSMLNGQTLIGKTLAVSIDPGPHKEIFLPVGLKSLGPGFRDDGKPLKDIVIQYQRHLKGKQNSLSDTLFGGESGEVKSAEDVVKIEDSKKSDSKTAEVAKKTNDDSKTESRENVANSTSTVTASRVTKDKISQTDNDGSKIILETAYELKKNGVSTDAIVEALKALKPNKFDSKKGLSKTDSGSNEFPSRRSFRSKSPPARKRSVSPRHARASNPTFGPRSGSSGNFRQNSPSTNNTFNNNPSRGPNTGPFSSGPSPNSGPYNNGPGPSGPFNNGPGPNVGPFNNVPFVGPNNMPNDGPNSQWSQGPNMGTFNQQGGIGPCNIGPFGPNAPSGNFGGISGPSGPNPGSFVGNNGPCNTSGPNQQFGGPNMMGPNDQNNRSSSNVVVLNNLPPSVTYQLLTEKMNQCGSVQFLNVTKPGTALVRYMHDWEAARCINTFDKTVVDGHQIEVRFS